ncbi:MAG TPA: alpha/beta fold hydrolase, partial [Xanthobacteraceae bacterium]
IRGENRNNPVLLFLHGGPGDVTNPWTFALFAPWEKQFTVVQWDQRGAGRTLRKTGPSIAATMTLERMSEDGIELTEYLRKHLGQDKIVVVAHSFGSILGLRMVRSRPDLFYAYVGTGQVADETRNYAVAYEALLKKARSLRNQRAVEELTRVGPPPYASGEGFGVQRKWSNNFEGADQFLPGPRPQPSSPSSPGRKRPSGCASPDGTRRRPELEPFHFEQFVVRRRRSLNRNRPNPLSPSSPLRGEGVKRGAHLTNRSNLLVCWRKTDPTLAPASSLAPKGRGLRTRLYCAQRSGGSVTYMFAASQSAAKLMPTWRLSTWACSAPPSSAEKILMVLRAEPTAS